MKKTIYLATILMLALCASNGFAQDSTKSTTKTQTTKAKTTDAKFMMMNAVGGMNEIGLSKTVLSKTSNDEIKQFAQQMIDDHTKAGDELKTIADSKNVTLPMDMDAKHKVLNDKLSSLGDNALDAEYLSAMVKDHEKTLAMVQKESTNGKDADAKAFAAKQIPVVQGHLEMAKSMMTKMMGKSTMKSSGK